MKSHRRTPALFAVTAALLVASGIRCGGTTGDHRVRFGGTFTGAAADGVTARGWTLHFDTFVVALGPVRIYSDDSFLVQRPSIRPTPFFSLGVAFAQHCHGCPKSPVAEFGFQSGGAVFSAVDLLSPSPFALGPADARNGWYRSVAFTFESPIAFPDGGVTAQALGGHSMHAQGTATREGIVVPFVGDLDLHPQPVPGDPTAERPYTTYGVMFDNPSGVFIDETDEMHDRVAIRVQLARMFDQADFANLHEGTAPGEPRVITDDSQVARAWRLGVEDPRTFRVGWIGTGGHGDPADVPTPMLDAGR